LAGALEPLTVAEDFLRGQGPVELVSDEMRSAARRLEVMIGKVGVEDLLDEIFLRFCIGK
jgi:tRNA modification GTPase